MTKTARAMTRMVVVAVVAAATTAVAAAAYWIPPTPATMYLHERRHHSRCPNHNFWFFPKGKGQFQHRITQSLNMLPLDVSSQLVVAASEGEASSWRQYVPLVVSGAVIIDILLGSPVANTALRALNPKEESEEDTNKKHVSQTTSSKERIDSRKVADAAVQKAKYTLELRNYLESNKSDYDRMQDLKRQMDQQQAVLEQNSQALASQIQQQQRRQPPTTDNNEE